MTDKEYNAQKRRVKLAYQKWHSITGLGEWIRSHAWHRDGNCGKEGTNYGPDTTARAEVQWEYITVCFHWNLENIATLDDDTLDRVIRHEISHVLINEMRMWGPPTHRDEQARDEAMKHEERVVTKLASILLWCRMKGQIEAKRQSARRTKKGKP
jgi:hypothetical protein